MEMCDELKKKPKRKFSEAWLCDDRYKFWIRQVPSDNTLFYCTVCNKNFSCSSHVSRHVDSACHKNKLICNIDNTNVQHKKVQKKIFRQQWLDIPEFKLWLREAPNDATSFYCLMCDRPFIGGLSEIYQHAESNMHKDNCGKSDVEANKSNEDLKMQTDESPLTFDER